LSAPASCDQPSTQFRQCFKFACGFAFIRQDEILAATARRHTGQFFQRRRGRAEAREQVAESDGADILGTRQPQPGAALIIVHFLFGTAFGADARLLAT
jgi:hypothetical protein